MKARKTNIFFQTVNRNGGSNYLTKSESSLKSRQGLLEYLGKDY